MVGGRAAAAAGLPPAAQCFGLEGTDSNSAHSPLAEARGIRKATSIICPGSQGPGVLGGQQSADARDWAHRGAHRVSGQLVVGPLVMGVAVAVLRAFSVWFWGSVCGSGVLSLVRECNYLLDVFHLLAAVNQESWMLRR